MVLIEVNVERCFFLWLTEKWNMHDFISSYLTRAHHFMRLKSRVLFHNNMALAILRDLCLDEESSYFILHVAVPNRNRILFCHVFRAHHQVRLMHWVSTKGRVHMQYVNAWISDTSMKNIWAPPSAEEQCYSMFNFHAYGDGLKVCYEIIFDFYSGLPHMF